MTISNNWKIALVVAMCTENGGIGLDGKLPWNLPGDLAFFRKLTTTSSVEGRQNAVVMGRRTWESIPAKFRPLANRLNVIISRDPAPLQSVIGKDGIVCASLSEGIQEARVKGCDKIFIIGGASIYKSALEEGLCDRLYVTKVEAQFPCDTFLDGVPFEKYRQLHEEQIKLELPWLDSVHKRDGDVGFTFQCDVSWANPDNQLQYTDRFKQLNKSIYRMKIWIFSYGDAKKLDVNAPNNSPRREVADIYLVEATTNKPKQAEISIQPEIYNERNFQNAFLTTEFRAFLKAKKIKTEYDFHKEALIVRGPKSEKLFYLAGKVLDRLRAVYFDLHFPATNADDCVVARNPVVEDAPLEVAKPKEVPKVPIKQPDQVKAVKYDAASISPKPTPPKVTPAKDEDDETPLVVNRPVTMMAQQQHALMFQQPTQQQQMQMMFQQDPRMTMYGVNPLLNSQQGFHVDPAMMMGTPPISIYGTPPMAAQFLPNESQRASTHASFLQLMQNTADEKLKQNAKANAANAKNGAPKK